MALAYCCIPIIVFIWNVPNQLMGKAMSMAGINTKERMVSVAGLGNFTSPYN